MDMLQYTQYEGRTTHDLHPDAQTAGSGRVGTGRGHRVDSTYQHRLHTRTPPGRHLYSQWRGGPGRPEPGVDGPLHTHHPHWNTGGSGDAGTAQPAAAAPTQLWAESLRSLLDLPSGRRGHLGYHQFLRQSLLRRRGQRALRPAQTQRRVGLLLPGQYHRRVSEKVLEDRGRRPLSHQGRQRPLPAAALQRGHCHRAHGASEHPPRPVPSALEQRPALLGVYRFCHPRHRTGHRLAGDANSEKEQQPVGVSALHLLLSGSGCRPRGARPGPNAGGRLSSGQ